MNKTEFWEAVLINDEGGFVILEAQNLTAGELNYFLSQWNDEELVMMRSSICFGRVD